MAQVKLIKLNATTQLPQEFDSSADDITLNSFTAGSGPVVSPTGIDMNNQDVSDISDLSFNDPAVGTIVGTTANDTIIIDNLMGELKENVMGVGASILFPVITDVAGEVDAFALPQLAGVPTATPADGTDGHMVYDSTGKTIYFWDGAVWNDLSGASSVDNTYIAGVALAACEVVYISAADTVLKGDADASDATAAVIGFAKAAALITDPVSIVSDGLLGGFSGLTAGARYYLSATAGAITATPPTGSNRHVVQVGYAKSATELQILIQYMGKKAA